MSEEKSIPMSNEDVIRALYSRQYKRALRRVSEAKIGGSSDDFREALEKLSLEDRFALERGTSVTERLVFQWIAEFERNEAASPRAPERSQDWTGSVPEEPSADSRSLAPPAPPPFGEALVGLFCSRDMREAVLGDLDEKFGELAERRGCNFAKAWYWGQAARSALFFAFRWGRRLLELETILKRIL